MSREEDIALLPPELRVLGKAMESARERIGLTKAQLAEKIPCAANYLFMLETSRRIPTLKFLVEWSDRVKRPLSSVFGEAEARAKREGRKAKT